METDAGTDLDEAAQAREALSALRATLEDGTGVAERIAVAAAAQDAALRRLEAMCTGLVRHLDTALLVVDAGLRVRMASPPAERLLGAGDVTGRSLGDLVPAPLVGAVRRCITPVEAGEEDGAGAAPAPASATDGALCVTVERVVADGPPQTWARFLPDRRPLTAADLPPAFALVRLREAGRPGD